MCENHDGLTRRSVSEQRRLHSPSVEEQQEVELEPSTEQDEDEDKDKDEDKDQDQDHSEMTEEYYDGEVTPSRKKEIMVVKIS